MIKRNRTIFCILPLLLALVSHAVGQNNGCKFTNFNLEYSPVFVRTHGSHKRFSDPRTPVEIPHGGSVTVYCDIKKPKLVGSTEEGGWQTSRQTGSTEEDNWQSAGTQKDGWLPNEQFVLKCKNGTVSTTDYNDKNSFISCHVPGYFQYPHEDCKGEHYVTGLKVDNTKIMFASICYNLEKLTTQYVKYVPKTRGNLVSQQVRNDPVSHFPSNPSYVDMPGIVFSVLSDDEIRKQLESLVGDMSNALSYSEASLLPSHIFSPILNHEDKVNTIVWWNQLRHGNWKVIQKLLSQQADVEVYAGTSHVATAENKDNRKVDLEFAKLNNHKIVAPLYVWNYVKSTNSPYDVVIIGVNSPYVDPMYVSHRDVPPRDVFTYTRATRNGDYTPTSESDPVCRYDDCSHVEWLKGVTTLKLPAFGYVVCCQPWNLKIKLDGLPTKFLTSQTTPPLDSFSYGKNGHNPDTRPTFYDHNGHHRDINNFHLPSALSF